MAVVVPELGSGSWVKDPLKQLELLFAHALTSNYSQSTIYPNKVTSIPYIIAKYQQYPESLISEMNKALTAYLLRYFSNVNVQCGLGDETEDNRYDLNISATVTRDGVTHGLSQIITLKDGKIVNVIRATNR